MPWRQTAESSSPLPPLRTRARDPVCEPGPRSSLDTTLADTLVLHFQPQDSENPMAVVPALGCGVSAVSLPTTWTLGSPCRSPHLDQQPPPQAGPLPTFSHLKPGRFKREFFLSQKKNARLHKRNKNSIFTKNPLIYKKSKRFNSQYHQRRLQ